MSSNIKIANNWSFNEDARLTQNSIAVGIQVKIDGPLHSSSNLTWKAMISFLITEKVASQQEVEANTLKELKFKIEECKTAIIEKLKNSLK